MPKIKKYPLVLRWAGRPDTPMLRASAKYCSAVTVFDATKARLVTYEEALILVEEGKLRPLGACWHIKPDQLGLVSENGGNSAQWEMVSNCKMDFEAGWLQALKEIK